MRNSFVKLIPDDERAMTRIKILPEQIASQIAAGEVVQRPASVVKELVDNSLDSGAGRITVEIEKGGNTKIRVVDDGCGMAQEDLPLAIRRHATSKIEAESDLLAIQTYGFRGEALAAISSVSHVEIISRLSSERHGHCLVAVGGEISSLEPIGAPPGTSVTVSDLFFNTPARKKFLKSPSTEMDRITEVILRTAICHPGLHLELIHNARRARLLSPVPSCIDRLVQLMGTEITKDLLPVDHASEQIQVTGFTSRATLHRNHAGDIYFFVNQRFVRDRLLLRGLSEAYKASLPQRRYPVSIIFIELPPEMVDVNVHPTKEEIRFRDERLVWSGLYSGIRGAFDNSQSKVWIEAPLSQAIHNQPQSRSQTPARIPDEQPITHRAETSVSKKPELGVPAPENGIFSVDRVAPSTPKDSIPQRALPEIHRKEPDSYRNQERQDQKSPLLSPYPTAHWLPIAQVFNSFIIATLDDQMGIFDQHALHERFLFEKFRAEHHAQTLCTQQLMFPVTLEFPSIREDLLARSLPILAEVGYEIEPFGTGTFVVRTLPVAMNLNEVQGFIEDALHDLDNLEALVPLPDRIEKVLARMACRSAVKAGDPLSIQQMTDLLDHYRDDPQLATCPHGRPPLWKITRREIERWFER